MFWHLAIGDREGSYLWVVMLRLLNLPNTLFCSFLTITCNGEMSMTSLEFWYLSAPIRWLEILGRLHFSCVMVESRDDCSNMNGFLSFSDNMTNISWSVISEWEMLAWGGCWKCCVCKPHWWPDYCVLLLYFSNICWILLCKKGSNFLLDRTICRLCFVSVVMKFYL